MASAVSAPPFPTKNYLARLDEKLNEELAEYQESKSMEELADLLEVIHNPQDAEAYANENGRGKPNRASG